MAIGEAFVNVRADLRPFSKDLEKGLKVILVEAERKIGAEASSSSGIAAVLTKKTSEGVEKGLDEGSKKGMQKLRKNVAKDAPSVGEKLLKTIADQLGGLPPEVTAALLGGVAALAPGIASVVAGSIVAGTAVGFGGLGIFLERQRPSFVAKATSIGRDIEQQLATAAIPVIAPAEDAIQVFANLIKDIGPELRYSFQLGARSFLPLSNAIAAFIRNILPGIDKALERSGPVIQAISKVIASMGNSLATFFDVISRDSQANAHAIEVFGGLIDGAILGVAYLIEGLQKLFDAIYFLAEPVKQFSQSVLGIKEAAPQAVFGLTDLNSSLYETETAADLATSGVAPLVQELLKGPEASLKFAEALLALRDSINAGNKSFDETTHKGQENLNLVYHAIQAAADERDAQLALAIAHHQSTDQINENYRRQLNQIDQNIQGNDAAAQSIHKIIEEARNIPPDLNINVTLTGTDKVNSELSSIKTELNGIGMIYGHLVNAQVSGNYNPPSGGVVGEATGDIIKSPTLAMIAEAGYDEVVIPDPRVMPARATQLANEFGLTKHLASQWAGMGKAPSVSVQVFIDGKEFRGMIDARVQANNDEQARNLDHGARV